ncbi:MAG: hypothetical protein ACE5H3_03890 [Planctomycetota bacterium]
MLFVWRGEGPESAAGEQRVDLQGAGEELPGWWASGGGLALQALIPYVSQPGRDLELHTLLAAGPGAALPALAALVLGFGTVTLASSDRDRQAFLAACDARNQNTGIVRTLDALDEAPKKPGFHLALLGCGETTPPLALCAGLAARVRAEGLMVIFGVPRGGLGSFFHDLAKQGFSLRGCGFHGGLAFLSGSPLPARIPAVK